MTTGYGKLAAGGGGLGVGGAVAALLAKMINVKYPSFLSADDGSLVAFVTLIEAVCSLPAIYFTPHNLIGGTQ